MHPYTFNTFCLFQLRGNENKHIIYMCTSLRSWLIGYMQRFTFQHDMLWHIYYTYDAKRWYVARCQNDDWWFIFYVQARDVLLCFFPHVLCLFQRVELSILWRLEGMPCSAYQLPIEMIKIYWSGFEGAVSDLFSASLLRFQTKYTLKR